jgi:hypothetical protein
MGVTSISPTPPPQEAQQYQNTITSPSQEGEEKRREGTQQTGPEVEVIPSADTTVMEYSPEDATVDEETMQAVLDALREAEDLDY